MTTALSIVELGNLIRLASTANLTDEARAYINDIADRLEDALPGDSLELVRAGVPKAHIIYRRPDTYTKVPVGVYVDERLAHQALRFLHSAASLDSYSMESVELFD